MDLMTALLTVLAYVDGSDRSLVKLLKALHVITDAVWSKAEVTDPATLLAKINEIEAYLVSGGWQQEAIKYVLEFLASYLGSK